jgi:hypothetical protein
MTGHQVVNSLTLPRLRRRPVLVLDRRHAPVEGESQHRSATVPGFDRRHRAQVVRHPLAEKVGCDRPTYCIHPAIRPTTRLATADDQPERRVNPHTGAVSDVQTYGKRRPYAVPDRLTDLTGPASGHAVLPPELGWTGRTDYDPADAAVLYERVLVDAVRSQDVTRLLNASRLRLLWSRLFLPTRVRHLRETASSTCTPQPDRRWTRCTSAWPGSH